MFDWSDKYVAGDEVIDHEHKVLLELADEFEAARLKNASPQELHDILMKIQLGTQASAGGGRSSAQFSRGPIPI